MKIKPVKITVTSDDLSNTAPNPDRDKEKQQKQLMDLYDSPEKILELSEPSEEQKEIALTEMPELIKDLKAPTEEDFLISVRSDGLTLRFIKTRTKKIINEAVKQNGEAIQYVDDPSDEQIRYAIINNPMCIKHLTNPKPEYLNLAVNRDGLAIQHIDNPSEQLQLAAVKQHSSAITLIKDPTKKVKTFAVEQDGLNIEYIKDPDEQLQLLSIDTSDMGYAYRYIDKPTPQVDIAAYHKNKQLLPFLKNIPEEIQIEIVSYDITNFKYIKVPTKKVQHSAIKYIGSNPHLFDDVLNIEPDVLKDVLKEIEFKEKSDKHLQIPEGLNLTQLYLYRYFQKFSKKEIPKVDLKRLPTIDDRVKTIIKSVKGSTLKLSDITDYKVEKPESEIGMFIQKKFGLARIEYENKVEEIFGFPSTYFVVYADAIKLLDLEFNKVHIQNMSKSLADKQQPYIPSQYILGYVRYSCYKKNIWISDFWTDKTLRSQDDDLKWMPQWMLSLFIRELRYRDYNKFYSADTSLRKRLYSGKDAELDLTELLQYAYFQKVIIKEFHPLINGKEVWCLS